MPPTLPSSAPEEQPSDLLQFVEAWPLSEQGLFLNELSEALSFAYGAWIAQKEGKPQHGPFHERAARQLGRVFDVFERNGGERRFLEQFLMSVGLKLTVAFSAERWGSPGEGRPLPVAALFLAVDARRRRLARAREDLETKRRSFIQRLWSLFRWRGN